MLSGRKDRRELPETLRTNKNKLCRTTVPGRGKTKDFGFSLTSNFHKVGEHNFITQLGLWQKES